MSHSADTHKLLEILRNKLRSIGSDDPGLYSRKLLSCPLDDDLDICLLHALSDLPVHDIEAVAVQHSAQVIVSVGQFMDSSFELGDRSLTRILCR